LRRLLSILLLAAFALPLLPALSALGDTPESRLPACCRRNGTHHCVMSAAQMDALLHGKHFTVIRSKCPLYPQATEPAHLQQYSFQQAGVLLTAFLSPLEMSNQVDAWAPTAREGDRHQRGPPAARLN